MTLRRRLTLLVALAVVIPITAVGVTVANLIGGELERRTFDRLQQAADFARAELVVRQDRIDREAAGLAGQRIPELAQLPSAERRAALGELLRVEDLDFVVVADESDTVVTSARREARFIGDLEPPSDAELVTESRPATALTSRAPVEIPNGPTASLTVGIWLDETRLASIFRSTDVDYVVVAGDRLLAATAAGATAPTESEEGAFRVRIGGAAAFAVGADIPGTTARLLAVAAPPENLRGNLGLILALLLAMVVVLIALVSHVVAGLITGPVQELVDAADEVARGRLDQRVEVKGDAEIAALGAAFNRMTDNLRDHVNQLEQSRVELRQAVDRLGDVLVSTHDLDGIIEVVLETSMLTLRCERAVFFDRVAMPARIRLTASEGTDLQPLEAFELNGTGVAGTAARSLAPTMAPGAPLDPAEPRVETAIAVPVRSDSRLSGVLAVYGRQEGGTFTNDDVDTLATLARQTEVAIGNVRLYDETQRQARTDPMTGLWNRREFEMRSRELLKEALRFGEPFGIIMVDADDFSDVNNNYDHLTGDAALIWIAAQLSEATREYDVVARWGGEEFMVLLPRTGEQESTLVAERIRMLVASEPLVHDDNEIHLTVSVGLACYPTDAHDVGALLLAADEAMLRAKRAGKNRVERATPDRTAPPLRQPERSSEGTESVAPDGEAPDDNPEVPAARGSEGSG